MARIAYLSIIIFLFSCKQNFKSKNKNQTLISQKTENTPEKPSYKPSRKLTSDLLHTKLEVSFDWSKKQLLGKATLQFTPYFYPQNSITIDAKGFEIKEVKIIDKKGEIPNYPYTYDSSQIKINFNKTYIRFDTFSVFINYLAKPEELKTKEGTAITSDKGLYFIIPDSSYPNKPYQIWTQGEPESSSCWFPTIDSPNERCTQEIFITVNKKYKTLSNGELIYSTKASDTTRTDYWKMDLPHAPYLFMMAIGDFAIVKDYWNGKEVSYYVEPKFEKYARNIFGKTPEMIDFFSKKLNYKYPWPKYSSIVVRDYVSGAMENTSASIFMEQLQRNDRQLIDENWENIIAHELFHHWFGDLVTCESWANLSLNESFANYSEYLWVEHKYGKDAAEAIRLNEISQYMRESEYKNEPVIRYHHKDAEDMFDSHSYSKGGAILHMLRKYVGDEAFYEALHIYLMKHAFQSVEIHNLRLAFESVVKEDLNWFFNQWFLAAGHPILDVSYSYKNNDLTIKINQTQDFSIAPTYTLPLKIDYWVKGKKYSQNVEINSKSKDFIFKADSLPDLIMVDTECQLLGVIKKSNKAKQWQFQYQHYEHYPAKIEALEQLKKSNDSSIVIQTSIEALSHSFENIRMQAIENLGDFYKADSALIKGKIALIAQKDKSRKVKIKAIDFLASLHDSVYKEIYLAAMRDSSYALTAQGLSAYLDLKPKDGSTLISELEKDPNPEILEAIAEYYANMPDTSKFEWFIEKLKKEEPENKYMLIQYFGKMSSKASISKQEIALGILEKICRYDTFAGLRFSAYQSMDYFKQTDSLKSIRKDIRAKEKHPRLKEFYSQYE